MFCETVQRSLPIKIGMSSNPSHVIKLIQIFNSFREHNEEHFSLLKRGCTVLYELAN